MFLYFNESPRWSVAMALAINAIGGQGAEFGDINWAGRQLRNAAQSEDTEVWHAVWLDLAQRLETMGDQAMDADDCIGGRGAYLRACTYFQMAERFLHPDDGRKIPTFSRSLHCFDAASKHFSTPVEVVEIPYEDSHLSAIFVHPTSATTSPFPVVIFYGGLDSTKEQLFYFGGCRLAEYGIGVLIVDGPGIGASLRLLGHKSRFDYEIPTRAAVDWLTARDDVDPQAIGLMGVSLGGYYAARGAAGESRLAAAAAWGAIWDYHAAWRDRVEIAPQGDIEHIKWVLGAKDAQEVLRKLKGFKLEGVAQQVSVPFLTVHGAADRAIAVEDARRFHDALGSQDKTLVILDEEDFGDQHSQIDNMSMAHFHLFPWLRKRLVGARVGEAKS